jgi:hypothetical protein
MTMPDEETWAILKEAQEIAKAEGTTAAVFLAMQIQLLKAEMPKLRRVDPRLIERD